MFAKISLGGAAIVALTVACAPGPSGARCAKVSSVVNAPEQYNLTALHAENAYPRMLQGYVLVTERRQDESGAYMDYTFKCAGQAGKSMDDLQIVIWTADHCVDFRALKSLKFVRYDSSELTDGVGIYTEDDSVDDATAELRKIRTAMASVGLSEAATEEIMSKLMPSIDKTGEAACQADYTAWSPSHDSGETKNFQRMCSSLEDLVMIAFAIPAEGQRSASMVDLLARLEALNAANPVPESSRPGMTSWEGNYKSYLDRRFKVGAATLAEALASCGGGSPKLSTEVCSKKDVLQMAIGTISQGYNANATVASAKAAAQSKFAEIRAQWTEYLGTLTGKEEKLLWAGNFVFGPESQVRYEFGPLKIFEKTVSLLLPDRLGLTTAQLPEVTVEPLPNGSSNIGVIFTRPKGMVQLDFKPGDSGSLLMYKLGEGAYLPMGVLSTVNGGPVSGGLAMRPAGSGEEDEQTQPKGDGTVVSQPPASQPPGGCDKT